MNKKLNEVTKEEVKDAIMYFHVHGFAEDLRQDPRHYVDILLKASANYYNFKLEYHKQ